MYFSYGLPNRLIMVKFQTLHCVNVADLGLGLGTIYTLHIAISFAVAIKYIWKTGSLQEASKCVLFPLCHFVQPIFLWVRLCVPGFIICSVELQLYSCKQA